MPDDEDDRDRAFHGEGPPCGAIASDSRGRLQLFDMPLMDALYAISAAF